MKGTQKITRVQLKINQKDESSLVGIVTAEPDYKLSLSLNKIFKISLKTSSPVKIFDEKGFELEFSRFSDNTNAPEITYNLISNRSGNNYLLKKLKNIDYIFQVQDPYNLNDTNIFTASLRAIDSVTAVFNIDNNIIKDKNLQYLIQ